MKKLSLIILCCLSIASDVVADFTFGVARQDLSGDVSHISDDSKNNNMHMQDIEVGLIKAVYPIIAMEGGVNYLLRDSWGTGMRVKVGGSSLPHDLNEVDVRQYYDMSAQWLLTYGEKSYIQVGPLWQRSKMNFGWRQLKEDLYLDGYGIVFGVYHPLFEYMGLRVNFQHVINDSVHPCSHNAESEKIGTLKTGMSQLSIALSSDLSIILN